MIIVAFTSRYYNYNVFFILYKHHKMEHLLVEVILLQTFLRDLCYLSQKSGLNKYELNHSLLVNRSFFFDLSVRYCLTREQKLRLYLSRTLFAQEAELQYLVFDNQDEH